VATTDVLLQALKSFVVSMKTSYDINEISFELSTRVAEALGVSGAGVSVADASGWLRFVTGTDERIIEIEKAQEVDQKGPCVSAFEAQRPLAISDIQDVEDWPTYKTVADQLGLRAVVGYPIGERLGAINVYHEDHRVWSDSDLDTIGVFSDMATASLVRMTELLEARQLADQLQHALDSRVIIEQAKGVLARQYDISVDEAFDRLRRHSRVNNIKLVEICSAVVNMKLEIPVEG
jgi:GAF domain-containing protein